MAYQRKVIEGLECIVRSKPEDCVKVCGGAYKCTRAVARNALELLKEQTTTWVEEKDRYYHWHCEKCGFVEGAPAMTHKYCPNCGRKVMRDE